MRWIVYEMDRGLGFTVHVYMIEEKKGSLSRIPQNPFPSGHGVGVACRQAEILDEFSSKSSYVTVM